MTPPGTRTPADDGPRVPDHPRGLAGWLRLRRAFAMHKLRWLVYSRPGIEAYVERTLQPQSFGWVFLLGVNNSGTTILANVLEHHPMIRCMPWEGQDYTNALPHPWDFGVARLWTKEIDRFRWTEEEEAADAVRVQYDWTLRYPAPPGFLFEKSPPNVLRSRWLQRHFQPASFIAICRSPYAVCEGICRRTGVSVEEAATHWTVANDILLQDMLHLERVTSCRYEELCDDPESVLTRLSDFLGLEQRFTVDALGDVEAHSMDGRTRGITNMNARSIERLSPDDIRVVNRIAGSVMEAWGYEQL